MVKRLIFLSLICACVGLTRGEALAGQAEPAEEPPQNTVEEPPKHIFGIVPNFRTTGNSETYQPITPKEKFKVAAEDSFDRGTVALAALFGGQAMLSRSTPSFGHGVSGSAKYLGSSYADYVVGNYMTEAVFPTLFHQDPRYFRRGDGSGWSRLRYAVGEIFWTRRDSGGTQFNFSEVLGNSTASAISTAYYADNRSAANAASNLGVQLGVDTLSNILKEFWPDLERKFSRKRHRQAGDKE